jgi:hypothetical protein
VILWQLWKITRLAIRWCDWHGSQLAGESPAIAL